MQRTTALVAAAMALLVAAAPAAAVSHATVHAGSAADFAAAAHSLDAGGRLTVTGYRLEGQEGEATLQLKHHQVWAPDAKVVVHTAEGTTEAPPPTARIFRGTIDGAPDSSVLLSVHEDGRMTGMAMHSGASWALGHEEAVVVHGGDSGSDTPAGGRRLLSLGSRRARLQEDDAAQPAEAPKPKSRRCGNRPGHSHGPERHQPDPSFFLQNAARKLAQVGAAELCNRYELEMPCRHWAKNIALVPPPITQAGGGSRWPPLSCPTASQPVGPALYLPSPAVHGGD